MQFAEGIPALLHKANVHRKIFLQQILNLAKGILPTPAFAFDEGRKTTAFINHNSKFRIQFFFTLLSVFLCREGDCFLCLLYLHVDNKTKNISICKSVELVDQPWRRGATKNVH